LGVGKGKGLQILTIREKRKGVFGEVEKKK
jgi:hypothetical protein